MAAQFPACLLALILLAVSVYAGADEQDQPSAFSGYHFDDPKQFERELERDYRDKVLTLRHFDRRSTIEVDSNGEIKGSIKPGPWTTHGKVQIFNVAVKRDRVDFEGRRLWARWHEEKKKFEYMGTRKRVRVRFRLPPQGLDATWLAEAFLKVFLGNDKNLADVVPSWWQPFLRKEPETPKKEEEKEEARLSPEEFGKWDTPDPDPAYRIGGEVSAPICLSCPDPDYPQPARRAKIEGAVVLWGIVNQEGRVVNLRIVRALGVGLDDEAVETVQKWRLEPARREGKPVSAYMSIEINFDLYER